MLNTLYRLLWWLIAPSAVVRLLWRSRRERGYREDEIGIVLHDAAHGSKVTPRFGRSEEQSLGEALPMTGVVAGIRR